MSAAAEVIDDVVAEAGLGVERARLHLARIEARDQVVCVPVRRVDCLLKVEALIDMAQKDVERPLLLLVAAGSPVGEPRLALAQNETWRERRPRTLPRRQRR